MKGEQREGRIVPKGGEDADSLSHQILTPCLHELGGLTCLSLALRLFKLRCKAEETH